MLKAEGIVFSADEREDLKRSGWDPSRDLSEEERRCILDDTDTISVAVSERLFQLLRNDPASPLRSAPLEELT